MLCPPLLSLYHQTAEKRKGKERKGKERKGKERLPFGVNFMRSQVLYRAAQVQTAEPIKFITVLLHSSAFVYVIKPPSHAIGMYRHINIYMYVCMYVGR